MAKVTPPTIDRRTAEALGGGLGMLATFITAMAFAFALPRLAVYVTFLMPVLVGLILAAAGAIGPRRFGFWNRRALVAMMIIGALVAWTGQHLLAYIQTVDGLSRLGPGVAAMPGASGSVGMQRLFELTGETGFPGYLSYIATELGAEHSPLGLLGKRSPGVPAFIGMALLELVLMAATASWSVLFRTRHLRASQSAQPLAAIDEALLSRLDADLDARRWAEAGRTLAEPVQRPTRVVVLHDGDATTDVQIYGCDDLGQMEAQLGRRLVPIEGGRMIRAAFAEAMRGKAG
jgi:hypothetical protein